MSLSAYSAADAGHLIMTEDIADIVMASDICIGFTLMKIGYRSDLLTNKSPLQRSMGV